jgi:hypothetical protein
MRREKFLDGRRDLDGVTADYMSDEHEEGERGGRVSIR